MAGTVNKAIVIGFIGQDADVRETQSGGRIISLSVATSERWRDRNTGERRERSQWHRVVIFQKQPNGLAALLVKGKLVWVEGQMETREWDDKGTRRFVTEVVVRDFNGSVRLLDKAQGSRPPAGGDDDYDRDADGYGDPT